MSAPDVASSTTLPSLIKAHRGVLAFAIVLALASVFSVLLVYGEDPFALGRLVVTGIAYLVAIVLTVAWFAESKIERDPPSSFSSAQFWSLAEPTGYHREAGIPRLMSPPRHPSVVRVRLTQTAPAT